MKPVNILIYSNKPGIRLLRHSVFWLADIFNWMVVAVSAGAPQSEIYTFLLSLPVCMAFTYFILYYLMPRHSGTALVACIVATVIAMGLVLRIHKVFVAYPLFDVSFPADYPHASVGLLIREIFTWLGVVSMAIIIKLVKNKTELQQRNEQLVAEKRQTELNFLKAQMHPHFLFNTLNTLYSETLHRDSREQEIVLSLSSLLRFTLEECNKPMISLNREIEVIRHYIDLERMRHTSRLNVSFKTPERDLPQHISPLIFLPFVENSFKHSLHNVRGTVNISIDLQVSESQAVLIVENDHVPGSGSTNGQGTGIGNIRRQLELLYGQNYSLLISDTGNKYRVTLSVPIKN